MNESLTRREILARAGALAGAGLAASLPLRAGAASAAADPGPAPAAPRPAEPEPLAICLNTATVRAHKLGVVRELEMAAQAGYRGVELWVDGIEAYEKGGGSLEDLRKRAGDLGLALPNAVAFFEWLSEDPARRAKALEDVRRHMDRLARIGCRHIAAPPAGVGKPVDLLAAAERYRELLRAGEGIGVIPALEIWGASQALGRLGQAAFIAMEAGDPKACIVPDVFHLHKSGSGLDGVRFLSGSAIAIFHVNDYPDKPREELRDAHRIFPGDGVAPLPKLIRDLRAIGYRGMLSLELFNPDHARRDPAEVLKEGFEKTRAVIQASAS
jgi:2-keto-myo-inositol isomerase